MHQKRNLELGNRLIAARVAAGETQETFCRHFKVYYTTYGAWERFGVPPGSTEVYVRMVLDRMQKLKAKREAEKVRYRRAKAQANKDAGI